MIFEVLFFIGVIIGIIAGILICYAILYKEIKAVKEFNKRQERYRKMI